MHGPTAMILALDTATDYPTIALGIAGAPGVQLRVDDRRSLSRDIGAIVAGLLVARGVTASALTGVLVADGPGAFTGLRIGAAFAKGMCRALGAPLFVAPSLLGAAVAAARAAGGAAPVDVDVRYDALRGECYRAVYRVAEGGVEVLSAPALAVVGEAAWGGAGRTVLASERDASAVALLGMMGWPGGPLVVADAGRWEPVYGRPAEAEARRLARERDAAGR
ncbi:MAG: tRNA (adenosine(37)-N6)-threonylcarbamoyltransferase complex dimerization subunit type 1 TsaB [Gemmatimonadales bacterium]|jgi:tRNA threonylcarbamoyl adenosine modification protein YeaZ